MLQFLGVVMTVIITRLLIQQTHKKISLTTPGVCEPLCIKAMQIIIVALPVTDYDSDGPEMEDVRRIIQPLALDSYLSSLNSSSHQ